MKNGDATSSISADFALRSNVPSVASSDPQKSRSRFVFLPAIELNTKHEEHHMPSPPKYTPAFPCVIIASGLRVSAFEQLEPPEQAFLNKYCAVQGNGDPWDRGVRYTQSDFKSFWISALADDGKSDPTIAIADGRQEGGDGGGGGDGYGGYFLDMLESRTKNTFWRAQPPPPDQIFIEGTDGTERIELIAVSAKRGGQPAVPTKDSLAANIVAANVDPCLAIYCSASEGQDFLTSHQRILSNIFSDIRLIAVKVGTLPN